VTLNSNHQTQLAIVKAMTTMRVENGLKSMNLKASSLFSNSAVAQKVSELGQILIFNLTSFLQTVTRVHGEFDLL
jgi:hypothetical protein